MVVCTMNSHENEDKPDSCDVCLYKADCITSFFEYCVFTGKNVLWTESDRIKRHIKTTEFMKNFIPNYNSKYNPNFEKPHSCDVCDYDIECVIRFEYCPYYPEKRTFNISHSKKITHELQHRCKICKKIVSSTNPYCAFCMNYEMEDSKCNVCGEVFSDFKDYDEHLLTHPQCEICGKRCKSESELKKHIKKEHYECEYCKKIFKSEQERQNHISLNHHCKVCGNNYKLLANHMKKHPYCEVCNKHFLTKEDYDEQHLKPHPKCNYCGKQKLTIIELEEHIQSHKCPVCFGFFHPLDEHLKSHPKCDLCGKLLFDDEKLAEHLRDEHQCDICGEQFVDKTELNKHRAGHFRYYCPVCKRKFINEIDLKEHLKTHLKCSFCSEYFKNESDLVKHLDDNHPKCEFCGTRFPTKSMLKKHKHKK